MLANHVLKDKKVILFYFVARTAAPAMEFIPYLKEAYEVRRKIYVWNLKYFPSGQSS